MNVYTDWSISFERLLKHFVPKTILEFGIGEGTQYFIDSGAQVKSIELVTNGKNKFKWFKQYSKKYINNPRWSGEVIECKDACDAKMKRIIYKATLQPFDFIFVDPGVHCRPEIVNQCFGKAQIIAVHDTNTGHEDYHWERLKVPETYTPIRFPHYQGTDYFIRDSELVRRLQDEFISP